MTSPVHLAPVVEKVDSAIHRINHYPLDSAIGFTNTYPRDSATGFPNTYPLDSAIGFPNTYPLDSAIGLTLILWIVIYPWIALSNVLTTGACTLRGQRQRFIVTIVKFTALYKIYVTTISKHG